MKRKIFLLAFMKILILQFILSALSCGRKPNIPENVNHDFVFGTEKGLYRTKDLHTILSPNIVPKKPIKEYQGIIKAKPALWTAEVQPNIFNLNELLKITTVGKGKKVKISSNDNIYIDPSIPFLNEYQILDYTIQKAKTKKQKDLKKLLGNINKFKGFPNTDYYIFSKLLGNYLILYKLASPDKIPYDELPLAKRVGNWLAVPLVGYPVEYCQAVRVKGRNNIKETLKYRPVCKGLSADTEYIRLFSTNKQVFEYKEKLDFFHRDFFDGKWLYYETNVRGSVSFEPTVKKAQLVKFDHSLEKLDVIEVNNLKQEDEKRVLFIPVEYKDYEIDKDSESLNSSFSERYKDVDESQSPYLQILFNKLTGKERGQSIKSAVITTDYISFDIERTEKGVVTYQIKHAFKRYKENKNYREKKWFNTDHYLFFHFYYVQRNYYNKLTDHTRNDLDHFKRVVRFDTQPEKSNTKEIRWYFSTQTNKEEPWIREMGHLAIDLINQAFEKAGQGSLYKIKMLLEDEDKELGDIRYNILNLIRSEGDSNKAFHRGFNIADPFTGEMISATANVGLSPIINEYIQLIRKYIRFHVYSSAWNMPVFSQSTEGLIKKHLDNQTPNLQCAFSKEYLNEEQIFKKPLGVTPFFHEKIQTLCATDVLKFIKDNQGKTFRLGDELKDHEIVRSCAQKMAKEQILQHILKSMLHSLGLRTMPSTSVDSENFYNKPEVQTFIGITKANHYFSLTQESQSHPDLPKYSSVMELMDKQFPILSIPGKLDISALRFLYFDRLDLTNGQTLEIPSGVDSDSQNSQKSILQTARDQAGYNKESLLSLQKHKMCGPNDVTHISCGKQDYGSTAIEIASNTICKIHNTFLINQKRYDAKQIEDLNLYNQRTNLSNMYEKWKDFRDKILKGKGQSIKDYSFLDSDDIEEYRHILENLAPELKAYEIIRRIIFDYFKRLSFVPAKHCIYNTDKGYKAIALENIEENMLSKYPDTEENHKKEFMSCKSDIAQEGAKEWAEKENLGKIDLITEVGFFGKERRYLIRPQKTDPVDELQNFQFIFYNFINDFRTEGLFQEPDLAQQYYNKWLIYATQGLDFNPYISKALNLPALDRVLSYKIDTMENIISDSMAKNLWNFRLVGLKWLKNNFKSKGKALFRQHFHYQTFPETALTELVNSFEEYPGLYSDFPILNQIYKDYKNSESEKSFYEFIKEHPAILYVQEEQQGYYRLPFADSEKHILSQLHRKYNEFSQCIREKEMCDQVEEKRAFIKLMLDTENDFFQ